MDPSDSVERYILTGTVDPTFPDWPGGLAERRRQGAQTLRAVLCRVVAWRARQSPMAGARLPIDVEGVVRARVSPMLRGLFSPEEAEVLTRSLPPRVVVLTAGTFPAAAERVPLEAAWDLANLLLDDLRVPTLADDVPELLGLCAGGRAWVLPRALRAAPLASGANPNSGAVGTDVIVHEVAHLLHIVPRGELGLLPPEGTALAVPARRRETFAYAAEAWACHSRTGGPPLGELYPGRDDARVDPEALARLLQEAEATADGPGGGWPALRRWAEGGRAQRAVTLKVPEGEASAAAPPSSHSAPAASPRRASAKKATATAPVSPLPAAGAR